MTQSGSTLQKAASFCRMPSSSGSSHRAMMTSGMMPMLCSSRTECWAGFVLCSPEHLSQGTSTTWRNMQFSRPFSRLIWRSASKKGWLSMSPMVPPISVMTTSAPV